MTPVMSGDSCDFLVLCLFEFPANRILDASRLFYAS